MADEEQITREWLESIRWPTGPVCVHCGAASAIYRLRRKPGSGIRPGVWKCGSCRKQFTVTVNTIFEETRLALSHWLRAIRLECGTPDGVTARQLADWLDIAAKTAGGILKKIRYAAAERGRGVLPRDSILEAAAHEGRRSLYPLSFEESVSLLLRVRPARKHPDALERRLLEMEIARRKRESDRRPAQFTARKMPIE